MYYAYLLFSQTYKEFYSGYTADLKKRYNEHLAGYVKSTKNRKMVLFFYEAFYSEGMLEGENSILRLQKAKEL